MKLSLLPSLSWSLFVAYTSAEPAFHSSGPSSPCPGFRRTNETTFKVSLTPDNSTLSFEASGLDTIMGNATFSLALFADGEQAYLTKKDPCLALASAELCPATGMPSGLERMDLTIPEQLSAPMGKAVLSAKNVTAQLWVEVHPVNGPIKRTACVQTQLRRDEESGGGESNSTSSTGADASSGSGNSTSNDNGSDGASDEESGAGVPQVTFSLVM